MFRSGMTKGIYKQFLKTHHLNRTELELSTYVYADLSSGSVKFVTHLYQGIDQEKEVYAVSIESDGLVELLSTE